jgi:predicted MFS family arabinose efflux permease
MADIRILLKNKPLLMISLSTFFVYLGHFLPFVYIPEKAKQLNLENYEILLSLIGTNLLPYINPD